jgi:two-component system response regulator FixJ
MTDTVFIVDDDPALRDALSQLLQTAGLQVETYADGETFLSACRKNPPGCVVLDMAMPGMNGAQVQAALNKCDAQIPVLFLSAHGDIPMAVRALQSGAMDFLEKPVAGAVLLARVRQALEFDAQSRQAQVRRQDIRRRYARLTAREREIMALVVSGRSNKEIARQLGVSPRTIESHRKNVMSKMGADSLVELVRIAADCET